MIHQVKTISQFYKLRNLPPPEHPLISVVDVGNAPVYRQIESGNVVFGFYVIAFKSGGNANTRNNRRSKGAAGGVLGFRAPGQVVKVLPGKTENAVQSGWMLCIHPDLLWHTPLAGKIRSYDFFYHDFKEALLLPEEEQAAIHTLVTNISRESRNAADTFSKKILVALIDALLAYIERFYQRQFKIGKATSHQLPDKLYDLLNNYFDGGKLSGAGLPTVAAVAGELNMSAHTLSATLRALTGKNAQQHIHERLIAKAKELLSATDLSVSEIAYSLGFEHLQSFSKLFRTKTRLSPLQFRQSFER